MKTLRNLERVNNYLEEFEIFSLGCGWNFVTSQGDATTKLDKLFGNQVLFARPELKQTSMDSAINKDYIDTACFVLTKDLGQGRTPEKENAQYSTLLSIADAIVAKIREDIASDGCTLLAGLILTDVQIVPESQIFGGWLGWSIDLSFEY